MKSIEFMRYTHRYESKRHCQYLLEIDDSTLHLSGGEIVALIALYSLANGRPGYLWCRRASSAVYVHQ